MKHLLQLFLTLALALRLHAAESPRPNFLFILTDDQGYGDLGAHGNPVLKTPNMDAIHRDSVRFTDFNVSPSCSPTRAALMTGMNNLRVGVTHTMSPRNAMSTSVATLPQHLKTAGYTSACIGKWHLNHGPGTEPTDRGFDHYVPAGSHYAKDGRYREDMLFDEARNFIERSQGQPFFCYLATVSPHAPLIVPDKYVEPYRGKVDDDTARFYAMIANIDENIGKLLRWLDEKKLSENTVVILMNDNGGTYGVDTFNAGMRGCKCTVWPGGTRAFSLWRWPGKWKPHHVDALTAHVDILPTLTALAGAQLPAPTKGQEIDGRSLVPLLEGREDPWFNERMLHLHNTRWPGGMAADHKDSMAAVRWRNYLLIRSRPCLNPECNRRSVSQCDVLRLVERGHTRNIYTQNAQFIWGVTPGDGWALYDVRKDPACSENLAQSQGEIASRLHGAHDRWWNAIYPQMLGNGGDARVSDEK